MQESLHSVPEGEINYVQVFNRVKASPPADVSTVASSISELFRTRDITPRPLINTALQELQQTNSLDQQALILTFSFLLEGKQNLYEGTETFLKELATTHNHTNEFTQPFKRFISERVRIANTLRPRRRIENTDEAKRMLELLKENSDFFHDLIDLQDHFSTVVSPVIPLNSTWNPLLAQMFKVRGAEGLWYVYANNRRGDYIRIMKQQMTSEWTGFNRFAIEPWDQIKGKVNQNGSLVDIGSSIGISAVEIAKTLDMKGPIVLLNYYNPLRHGSSLRITDYARPDRSLIPLDEALTRIEQLRENRVLISLYGVDFGLKLSNNVKTIIQDAAFVHCANITPYLSSAKLHQAVSNAIETTDRDGGILKFHNDSSLPIDNILHSITLHKQGDKLEVLPNSIKGKFD